MIIVSIYDKKAKVFNQTYVIENLEAFKRDLKIVVNNKDEKNIVGRYSEDFDLYVLGYINKSTGEVIKPKDGIVVLECNLSDLKEVSSV